MVRRHFRVLPCRLHCVLNCEAGRNKYQYMRLRPQFGGFCECCELSHSWEKVTSRKCKQQARQERPTRDEPQNIRVPVTQRLMIWNFVQRVESIAVQQLFAVSCS